METNLNESKLHARIARLLNGKEGAILSPDRASYTPQEKVQKRKEFESDLKNRGLGFYKVRGKYAEEKEDGSHHEVEEHSYILHGKGVAKHAVELGKKYHQDSVAVFKYGKAKLHGTGSSDWIPSGHERELDKSSLKTKSGEVGSIRTADTKKNGRSFSLGLKHPDAPAKRVVEDLYEEVYVESSVPSFFNYGHATWTRFK